MAELDFDIERLADYLHIDAAQVQRLAERGKIPGRRAAGAWRFSASEIHGWLENRIGLSDERELLQVESFLSRASGGRAADAVRIDDLLPIEAIEIPLAAKTRGSIIQTMVEVAARTDWLWDPKRMEEAVRQREEMHSTALDIGVALLHPRRPLPTALERSFLALGRTDRGVPFGDARGRLTDLFFLICSTDDREHLRVLARLSRMLADGDFVARLRAAEDPRAAREIVAACDDAMAD